MVEALREDKTKGRETLEMVEQSTLTGPLEPMRRVAVAVAEKLHALLVGMLSCISPEGPDEVLGARAEESCVVEDELLGLGEIGVGRRALPIDADAPSYEGTSGISAG